MTTTKPIDEQREQTDESLRIERDTTDKLDAKKVSAVEAKADRVVDLARERADLLVQTARFDADEARAPGLPSHGRDVDLAERERACADLDLEAERTAADGVLAAERTERKRFLAAFLAAEREATDKDLVGERAHADEVVATRDEFLATVSHDLRSLLGGLSLNATLLVDEAPPGPAGDRMRTHAATSVRLVARMDRVINDLLDVASIEAGKLGLRHERVEVAHILRDTLEAFEPLAKAKGITLTIEAAQVPLHAEIDGGRVLQVLANLLSNAIKFTPAGGSVIIRLREDQGQLHFEVSDTGVGVPPGELEPIFERFHQAGKDRRGLGLGLHICRSIVDAHGGKVWAESVLGEGATFHVLLPTTPVTRS